MFKLFSSKQVLIIVIFCAIAAFGFSQKLIPKVNPDIIAYQTPNSIIVIAITATPATFLQLSHPDSTVKIKLSTGQTVSTVISFGALIDITKVNIKTSTNTVIAIFPTRAINLDSDHLTGQTKTWNLQDNSSKLSYPIFNHSNTTAWLKSLSPLQSLQEQKVSLSIVKQGTSLVLMRPKLSPEVEKYYHLIYSPQESTLYSYTENDPNSLNIGQTYDSYDTWRESNGEKPQQPGKINLADYHFEASIRSEQGNNWIYTIPAGYSQAAKYLLELKNSKPQIIQ